MVFATPLHPLPQVPITIDDDFRIRVLEPEQCKKSEQLVEDCKAFVESESSTRMPKGAVEGSVEEEGRSAIRPVLLSNWRLRASDSRDSGS